MPGSALKHPAIHSYDLFSRPFHRGLTLRYLFEDNPRVEVLTNRGEPTPVPDDWKPILGEADVLVGIPDMHMFLYASPLDNFKFGAEAMLDFLRYLEVLKGVLYNDGRRLRVLQLGDMYELCFPHPQGGQVTIGDIRRSHPIYQEILDLFGRLDVTCLEGNHDFEYHRHRQSPEVVTDGLVYIEHGFAADHWYNFSNPHRIGWRPAAAILRRMRGVEARVHRMTRRWADVAANHASIGVDSGDEERSELPCPDEYPKRQQKYFARKLRQLSPSQRPRICVVAHTHHPTINTTFAGGEAMLVDAGAWTEGRSDFVVITNEELAVCRYSRGRQRQSFSTVRPAS